jgi:hypothetical protein
VVIFLGSVLFIGEQLKCCRWCGFVGVVPTTKRFCVCGQELRP